MPAVLGALLGCGLLLTVSPFLWPAGEKLRRGRHPVPWVSLSEKLTLAGLGSVTPAKFIVASAVAALAVGAIVLAFLPVLALGLAAAIATAFIPAVVVSWRARARRRSHRALWPDVVDHLVSAVRSGLSLADGVSALSRVGPAFTRSAFSEFEADYRATANFSRSLDRLKDRLADPVADRILETLRMSREVGGTDLTTILRNLSAYLRQEASIRAEVEARQSWVVNAARLGAIAPWVVLVLLAARPEAAMAYNSAEGMALIAGGFAITLIAYRVMIAIGRLPEEQRWFQ
ncbi:type II secretion system F family protein [Salinibacterium hongtaonis]|uniref:type II secretion system F family protein n=1 Tax=Homoserinimonas hongtaonis TaxID=2079791 RepID=UPI000D34E998|nr:type II secretion system F family protein [Salinibacterium hongtaonis]AWB88758.1 type II secretion system protein F [Salinibacterium hongtaonis]